MVWHFGTLRYIPIPVGALREWKNEPEEFPPKLLWVRKSSLPKMCMSVTTKEPFSGIPPLKPSPLP